MISLGENGGGRGVKEQDSKVEKTMQNVLHKIKMKNISSVWKCGSDCQNRSIE